MKRFRVEISYLVEIDATDDEHAIQIAYENMMSGIRDAAKGDDPDEDLIGRFNVETQEIGR